MRLLGFVLPLFRLHPVKHAGVDVPCKLWAWLQFSPLPERFQFRSAFGAKNPECIEIGGISRHSTVGASQCFGYPMYFFISFFFSFFFFFFFYGWVFEDKIRSMSGLCPDLTGIVVYSFQHVRYTDGVLTSPRTFVNKSQPCDGRETIVQRSRGDREPVSNRPVIHRRTFANPNLAFWASVGSHEGQQQRPESRRFFAAPQPRDCPNLRIISEIAIQFEPLHLAPLFLNLNSSHRQFSASTPPWVIL